MKKLTKYLIVFSLILLFVACENSLTPSSKYTDSGLQSSYYKLLSQGNNTDGTNFSVSDSNATVVTVVSTTTIVVTTNFANGRVDESDTNLANIHIYPVSDSSANTVVYTRGTMLTPVHIVEYTGNSTTITSTITTTSTINGVEIEINPELTANNSSIKFNQDGDIVEGEANDDIYYKLIDTTGLTTGRPRIMPSSGTMTLAAGTFTGAYDVTFAVGGTAATYPTTMTKDTLNAGLLVETYDYSTHTWNVIPVATYSTSYSVNVLTLDLPTVDDGTVFRWAHNNNFYQDPTLLAGDYQLKGTLDAEDIYDYTSNSAIKVASATYFDPGSIAISSHDVAGEKYIDVTFTVTSGNTIIASTLINNNIKFKLNAEDMYIEFDEANVELRSPGIYRFHFDTGNSIGTSNIFVIPFPTIMTDPATPTVSTDDRHFGDPANPLAVITQAS